MASDKKDGGVFAQIKLARKKGPEGTATEKFDGFRKKHLLQTAQAAVAADPTNPKASSSLTHAVVLDQAITQYREAITKLRALHGDDAHPEIKALKALKVSMDAEILASPDQMPESLVPLLQKANEILAS